MAGDRILIVEDNDKNLRLVRDVLHFNGYRTIEAMTAEDGLDLARAHQPALIIMDIQLPGMDGITAFRHLRADPRTSRIPVIAVTASATSLEQQQIIETGFDGLQTKPIRVNEFVKVIQSTLGRDDKTKVAQTGYESTPHGRAK